VYTVPPPQPKEKKPGQLEKWQLDDYFDKGFVMVPKFFTNEEMEPVIEVGTCDPFQGFVQDFFCWGGETTACKA
jgi:hypothetical protein